MKTLFIILIALTVVTGNVLIPDYSYSHDGDTSCNHRHIGPQDPYPNNKCIPPRDCEIDEEEAWCYTIRYSDGRYNCECRRSCLDHFDCDYDVDGTDAANFKADFGRSSFNSPCPDCLLPGTVPRTGQTTSWATEDDGDLESGLKWPEPRFTDNGDGTVTDNLTGLIWLKNGSCFGDRTWDQALSDCNGLADGSCGLTDGSIAGIWRLPNVKELLSLIDYRFSAPAIPNTSGTAQWTEGDPFTNLDWGDQFPYWASTYKNDNPDVVKWGINIWHGETVFVNKFALRPVWPVRGGH